MPSKSNKQHTKKDVRIDSPIREQRKKLGWTQAELARRAGYSKKHISRIECGYIPLRPSAMNTINLCKALGMTLNDLYGTGKSKSP